MIVKPKSKRLTNQAKRLFPNQANASPNLAKWGTWAQNKVETPGRPDIAGENYTRL